MENTRDGARLALTTITRTNCGDFGVSVDIFCVNEKENRDDSNVRKTLKFCHLFSNKCRELLVCTMIFCFKSAFKLLFLCYCCHNNCVVWLTALRLWIREGLGGTHGVDGLT